LSTNKASGPDEVPPIILKSCAEELAPILKGLCTQSLNTGAVPCDWKSANIVPVFKKGKLFWCYILSPYPHGFRKNHSCQNQLIGFIKDLHHLIEKDHQVNVIFLDFALRCLIKSLTTDCYSSYLLMEYVERFITG